MRVLPQGVAGPLLAAAFVLSVPEALCSAPAEAKTKAGGVYANDFEKQAGPEWSHRSIGVTPKGGRRFLGSFGSDEVRLTLKDLPDHRLVRISFDLFIYLTWDGKDWATPGAGPDVWSLAVEGRGRLLRCTFANRPMSFDNRQTFPDPYPGPLHPPQTGAAEKDTLGNDEQHRQWGSAVYRLSFAFAHRGSDVTFVFWAGRLEELGNESWGLDNVRVELLPAPVRLDGDRLEQCWKALQGDRAAEAFGAYRDLMAAGEQAAAFLEERLRPKPVDEATGGQIAALDSDRWSERAKATAELRKMGPAVVPHLRAALKGDPSLEAATRIRVLIEELTRNDLAPKDLARHIRIVRLLTFAGSPKAVEALGALRRNGPSAKVRCLAAAAAVRAAGPLIDALLQQAEAEARELDFAAARATCRKALDLARVAASPAEGRVAAELARLDELAGVHKQFVRLAARLKASPRDREIRSRLIRTALVELDSPKKAEAHLDAHSGQTWRRYVPLAARDADRLGDAEVLALGRWYRGLAADAGRLAKPAMLRRARGYLGLYVRRLRTSVGRIEAASASIEEELSRAAPAPWIDVLQHVYPEVHRVSGQWARLRRGEARAGGALRVSPAGYARLALPVAPRGDYELTAEFVRTDGSRDVNFILPVGPTGVMFTLDDGQGNSGFQNVGGRDLLKPDPPHTLTNGKRYRFGATIRREGGDVTIRITLNDQEYMRWRGRVSSLSVRESWAVADKGALGVGAHESTVEFSRLRLRMLTGRAEMRPVSVDPPPKPRAVGPDDLIDFRILPLRPRPADREAANFEHPTLSVQLRTKGPARPGTARPRGEVRTAGTFFRSTFVFCLFDLAQPIEKQRTSNIQR